MQREAGHRGAEDRARVEEPVEAHEVARARTEPRGREDVDDDVDEATAGRREHERDREQCVAGRRGFGSEQYPPEDQCPRERDTCTPAIRQHAAGGVDCGSRNDADRDQRAELGVREVERALDVDGRDRPGARERAEPHERRRGREQ